MFLYHIRQVPLHLPSLPPRFSTRDNGDDLFVKLYASITLFLNKMSEVNRRVDTLKRNRQTGIHCIDIRCQNSQCLSIMEISFQQNSYLTLLYTNRTSSTNQFKIKTEDVGTDTRNFLETFVFILINKSRYNSLILHFFCYLRKSREVICFPYIYLKLHIFFKKRLLFLSVILSDQ